MTIAKTELSDLLDYDDIPHDVMRDLTNDY